MTITAYNLKIFLVSRQMDPKRDMFKIRTACFVQLNRLEVQYGVRTLAKSSEPAATAGPRRIQSRRDIKWRNYSTHAHGRADSPWVLSRFVRWCVHDYTPPVYRRCQWVIRTHKESDINVPLRKTTRILPLFSNSAKRQSSNAKLKFDS